MKWLLKWLWILRRAPEVRPGMTVNHVQVLILAFTRSKMQWSEFPLQVWAKKPGHDFISRMAERGQQREKHKNTFQGLITWDLSGRKTLHSQCLSGAEGSVREIHLYETLCINNQPFMPLEALQSRATWSQLTVKPAGSQIKSHSIF